MFNLSFGEILILSVIGLLVLGPKQLPQVAKVIGRTYAEFRKAFQDVTRVVKTEMRADVLKKSVTNSIAGALLSEGKVVGPASIAQVKEAEVVTLAKLEKKSIEDVLKELKK